MSTRQLRRLQKQEESEIAALRDKGQAEVEDESDDPPSPQKPKESLFAKLIALEDDEDNEDIPEEYEIDIEPIETNPLNVSGPERARKLKSKKSKGKNRNKNKQAKKSEVETKEGVGGDEVEIALRQLGIKDQSNEKSQASTTQFDNPLEKICTVLSIDGKNLKVANEMRKLFGRAAIEDKPDPRDIAEREIIQRQQNHDETLDLETVLKGNNPPGKGISQIILRRNFFVQGRSEWPKGTLGGLSMEVVKYEKSNGIVEFRYVHNQSYQNVQNSFRRGVEIGDPQFLVSLLVMNPDHISLLLQVSKIAKSLGNHSLSSDLLERALFFLGKAASSHFTNKLSQGKARLNFARYENRELWLAGYHYIKSLMMKGTYRTALEWAKLLLSLDPDTDPYCMRLLISNLSLRARESEWLFDLYDSGFLTRWGIDSNSTSQSLYSHTKPSLALAAIYMKNRDKAREILTESMMRLPWLYYSLFCDLNLEVPPSLRDYNEPESDADALFTKIYISQTRDLWDTPETTSLLMEIGNTISKIEKTIDNDFNKLVTKNVVRFVYLDGSPEYLALIPRERLNYESNSDSDPIPPSNNIESYELQSIAIRDIHQPRSDYLVIGRINTNRETDSDENGDNQYTLEGISVAEVTEEGIQRLLPIESARRLFRRLLGTINSENENDNINENENENENDDNDHDSNIDNNPITNDNYDHDNSEDGELLRDRTNQNPSHSNPEEL